MASKATCVIAAGLSAADAATLRTILSQPDWDLMCAADWEYAARLVTVGRASVVLLDRDSVAGDWRTALARLAAANRSASVMLVSRVSDDYLWNEIIQAGGYDVVAKPFRKHELLTAIHFALRQSRAAKAHG